MQSELAAPRHRQHGKALGQRLRKSQERDAALARMRAIASTLAEPPHFWSAASIAASECAVAGSSRLPVRRASKGADAKRTNLGGLAFTVDEGASGLANEP